MRHTNSFVFVIPIFVGVALIAAAVGSFFIATHREHAVIDVVSKERLLQVTSSSEGATTSHYRNFVYTVDETYVVEDSFWNWYFSSATTYAKILPQHRCAVLLSGYRFGFFSMFQNILAARCRPLAVEEHSS